MVLITIALVWKILFVLIILAISSLPLYIAVKLFGGKAGLITVILTSLIAGIIIAILRFYLTSHMILGFIIPFILLLFIYKHMFQLDWIRSFLVWLLQGIIIIVLYWLFNKLTNLIGINVVAGILNY